MDEKRKVSFNNVSWSPKRKIKGRPQKAKQLNWWKKKKAGENPPQKTKTEWSTKQDEDTIKTRNSWADRERDKDSSTKTQMNE